MYEKLPLSFIGITDNFGSRKDPISNTESYHFGLDLGWHSYPGEEIYAIYDSTVIDEGYDDNLGNNITFSYEKDNNTIVYRYFHMKDRALVKEGTAVKRGDLVGYMGSTGYSTGCHLHFEYWVCPKGYKFSYGDRSKYAVNPLDYCFLFEDQTVSSNDVNSVLKIVGTSLITKENKNIDQIKVVGRMLRCRKNPSLNGEILGYIDYGIYNILETKENDNYTWYKIGDDKWIAGVIEDVNLMLTSPPKKEPDNIDLTNYNKFIALEDDYYFIKLKKDEVVYFPK